MLPAAWRAQARAGLRSLGDLAGGRTFKLIQESEARREIGRGLDEQLFLVQPIQWSESFTNKVHNLRLAAQRIENVALDPGELFSFWALVGRPSLERGFRPSRTLIAGRLQSSPGGGLCQLSGMLHALALRAGLELRERHPHSLDIYTDKTRFTPLGSDATVAYGYKDLRFLNTLTGPICFRARIDETELRLALCAPGPVAEYNIEHRLLAQGSDSVTVETLRTGPVTSQEIVHISHYQKAGDQIFKKRQGIRGLLPKTF
jgi:vancomycin resistance protein VanW